MDLTQTLDLTRDDIRSLNAIGCYPDACPGKATCFMKPCWRDTPLAGESLRWTEAEEALFNMSVYDEVKAERAAQDAQWGGKDHDDKHTNFDWIAYLVKHIGRSVQWPFNVNIFRAQMVKVAALAVAAIEWADRKGA